MDTTTPTRRRPPPEPPSTPEPRVAADQPVPGGPIPGGADQRVPGAPVPGGEWRSAALVFVAVTAVVGLLTVAASYAAALMYPGEASFSVRSVEWLRDHGGSGLVDGVENWWYTRHAPPTAAQARAGLPPAPPSPPGVVDVDVPSGAGHWTAWPGSGTGRPAMSSTFLRPDPAHPTVVVGVARFDQDLVAAHLIAGTREPDDRVWPDAGQVPAALRGALVATFNSGFKMSGANGGFFAEGYTARPLRDGAASLVITRDGRLSVDQWGRDRRFGPDVTAVRQNLALIVDGGRVVPGLDVNHGLRWGSARNQLQYTWRSALGVDRDGRAYYVAGDGLTLSTLAQALASTGAVRGMELDIHPQEVHMFAYRHPATGAPAPEKLLGTMRGPADRYLFSDERDFVALTLR
jgi:hypothetical protein